MKKFVGWTTLYVLVFGFISLMGTLVMMAIWPGELELTAPLFCDATHSDAFAVVDKGVGGRERGSTTYNFSLYCVSDDGNVVGHGFTRPFLVLVGAHTVPMFLWAAVRLGR